MNEITAQGLVQEAMQDRILSKYLPDVQNRRTLNRQFLFNVSDNIYLKED